MLLAETDTGNFRSQNHPHNLAEQWGCFFINGDVEMFLLFIYFNYKIQLIIFRVMRCHVNRECVNKQMILP